LLLMLPNDALPFESKRAYFSSPACEDFLTAKHGRQTSGGAAMLLLRSISQLLLQSLQSLLGLQLLQWLQSLESLRSLSQWTSCKVAGTLPYV